MTRQLKCLLLLIPFVLVTFVGCGGSKVEVPTAKVESPKGKATGGSAQ